MAISLFKINDYMSQIEMVIFFFKHLFLRLVGLSSSCGTPQFPFVVSDLFLHIRNTLHAPFIMDSEELERGVAFALCVLSVFLLHPCYCFSVAFFILVSWKAVVTLVFSSTQAIPCLIISIALF